MATSNPARPTTPADARRRWGVSAGVAVLVIAIGVGLFALWRSSTSNASPDAAGGTPVYAVGQPGPGQIAPGFALASSSGGTVSLASLHGKTVLLYFQEGLTCQPCWDQIKDLERSSSAVHAAGIDQVLSITTDPVDLLTQKTGDEGLSTPVLSDPNMTVSRVYHANDYGMMGDSRDGHTFLLVDGQGRIVWRADYGGAPHYTMFVPVDRLLADLKAGRSS